MAWETISKPSAEYEPAKTADTETAGEESEVLPAKVERSDGADPAADPIQQTYVQIGVEKLNTKLPRVMWAAGWGWWGAKGTGKLTYLLGAELIDMGKEVLQAGRDWYHVRAYRAHTPTSCICIRIYSRHARAAVCARGPMHIA
jgi:hypothetical protein